MTVFRYSELMGPAARNCVSRLERAGHMQIGIASGQEKEMDGGKTHREQEINMI
jgi:hypothetical protein